MRGTLLDHLAGSCNVRASAAAVGVTPKRVYALRCRDARFVTEWHEAPLAGGLRRELAPGSKRLQ